MGMARSSAFNFAMRAAAAGAAFASGMILNRLLGPSGRGQLSVLLIYPMTAATLAHMSVRTSLPHHLGAASYRRRSLLAAAVLLVLVSAALVALLYASGRALGGEWLWRNVDMRLIARTVWLAPLYILAGTLGGYLQGCRRFSRYSVLESLPRMLVPVLLAGALAAREAGWGGVGLGKVVIIFIASVLVAVIAGMAWSIAASRDEPAPEAPGGALSAAGALLRDGAVVHIGFFSWFICTRSGILILNNVHGGSRTGYYAVASLLTGGLLLVPVAVNSILYGTTAAMGFDEARDLACRTNRVTTAVTAVLGLAASGAAPVLVLAYGGRQFMPAAALVPVLALGVVCFSATGGGTMLQFHTRRFWISPVVNGPLMIGNVVGHLIVIPRYGAMGAAAVTAGTSVLKLAFELLLAWRLFGVGPGEICVASRADMATFFDRLAGLFGGKREPEGSQ